ncbi:hypothetical protein SAICODRAFT_33809 [Saitoella complicata NRRL Y-17804]|nr:uncharacterized protein SAICODRAFT_33809 [Saitoella complicata NRRL Y-17804]ODQ54619.1 hypothetical protein SAICODRAFT_33809 [Saitoella complicata NRRL Y-17804]
MPIFCPCTTKNTTVTSYCENSASSRQCWGDYDIRTNYYDDEAPFRTGVTRTYWLEVTNTTTLAPDGIHRQMITFNGTFPGPTIWANWGDEIEVHVTNKLQDNGTSVHWHGVRQLDTCEEDGVPGVTQMPIPPTGSYTYKFLCSQYGSSWYHSHFSLQYAEGAVGPLTVYGPTSAHYDEDLGPLIISDWRHETAFSDMALLSHSGDHLLQTAVNILLNGTNTYNATETGHITGHHYNVTVEQGKTYKMGLVGALTENAIYFSMDGHKFTIVSNDYVPVEPVEVDYVYIGIGQRYDIVFVASGEIENYWIRAQPAEVGGCAINDNKWNSNAVLRYAGAPAVDPTTSPVLYTDTTDTVHGEYPQTCQENFLPAGQRFTPMVPLNVPPPSFDNFLFAQVGFHWNGSDHPGSHASQLFFVEKHEDVTDVTNLNVSEVFNVLTDINETKCDEHSLIVNFNAPTLLNVMENEDNAPNANVYYLRQQRDEWVYFVVQSEIPIAHPIHLHGHDFFVLGQLHEQFEASHVPSLNLTNPMRRDVAMLPAGGALVLAWKTDNPGAWIMHCHIAWHVGLGLGLQFVELEDEMKSKFTTVTDQDSLWAQNAHAWSEWCMHDLVDQDDSGV